MLIFERQQNSTNRPIGIFLVLSDLSTPASGKTPTIKLVKDATPGTAVSASGAITEVDAVNLPGWYSWAGNATDRNTVGEILGTMTAAGCAPSPIKVIVKAYDPDLVLPTGNAGGANGLLKLDGTGTAITLTIDGDLDGTVTGNVVGDVQGKLLGGGIGTPTAVGAWVADGSGNPVGTAANQTTLLTRVSAARAGYLDNLNVGGAVASHADIAALNASASKHLLLVTVGQFEPGETYTVEMRTFAASTGAAVNADTTPTLTATGNVSGDLSANLSAATNPATGLYRWTYTPGATPTLEQIRFDGSATISASTFTLSAYSQTVDFATAVFTATDQTHLTSIFNKLPAGGALIGDATATTQTAIKAKTDLIATNAADSPEVVTAAGTIGTLLTRVGSPTGASVSADVAAVKSSVGSPMQAGTQVVLASNGLDQIATTTSGAPSTWKFPQWLMWLVRRWVRTTYDSNAQTMVVKDAAGTQISTQTATNAAGVQTTGELS